MKVYYILIRNIEKCALFQGDVYLASKRLQGKELEKGTILKSEQTNQTRFFVADRKEIFFDRNCVEEIDGKLELLTYAEAEQLLEIISLEERLRVFDAGQRRSGGQTEAGSDRRDTRVGAELSRPRTPSTKELRSAIQDEERQKLKTELELQKEQIDTLTAEREELKEQLSEKELRSARQDEVRQKLENELKFLREQTNTLTEKDKALEKKLSEKDSQLAHRDQQRGKWKEEKAEFIKRLKTLQQNLDEVTQAKKDPEQQVVNLEAESIAKEKRAKELEESSASVQHTPDDYRPEESCEWVISRNEIILTDQNLGKGAWGKVLLGRFRGCKVAVKQIHGLIRSSSFKSTFEREMNIASRCRHPCLLQFIGATNDEGTPLLVTELMETSLRAFLEAQFPTLSNSGISLISLDVALALNYLHKTEPLPIIHRDVSSANVLLWRQGPHWRGKVSDYGAANFMQQTMTIAPGTMVYSAPEALTPNHTVKIDVYSFGVLLCEMCTGIFPHPDLREKHISQVTNQEFKSLIQRCVLPNPKKRPDMKEICAEVEALYDHQSESEGDKLSIGAIEQMLRGAVRETNDGEQTREVHHEAIEPHTASSIQPSQESCDWTIRRDQIELTDECRGRGYVGKVFEGKYNGCAVAVKLVHEVLLSPEYRRLFEQEINIASRFRHPCLLQFIGATNDEEFPLIVTELMETSLQSLLTSRSLSEAEVCAISQDVAEALNYLHHREPSPIIHRDVCSGNVLLWRQGHQWRGKLTVSIATTFQQEIMTTAPGNMLYSAPETKGTKQTVKVDIYSFGVLLCEMCIGELPDPEQQGQQVARVKNHVLQELIHKCLPEDPEKRPGIEYVVTELRHGKLH
ncbi:probable serine/threonine-protein kinase DDB_G0271682 [Stylophora pistillata]|uniref:probable serine/threonine-protein kinase DDB_G0271682 n=1 Tax=Stylophora pistillata TaxID=50429 RepID=UPI000C045983|nr:probable serine/threonine-protein kinase DDB_G0271682 [Stylophora pistillata]